jgi:hypothetical protein
MRQTLGALTGGSKSLRILIAAAWLALLVAIPAASANGQAAPSARPDLVLAYRSDQEIRITATIQQVVSKGIENSPAGLHLMLAGPQGAYDASLGPFLSSDVKRSLASGKSVEVTGAMEAVRGQSYLLVRELTVDAKLITVRSEKGFLINARTRPRSYELAAKEGAR